eukprot:4715107-Pleurochrysis_carterae.AAC.1
MSLSSLKPNALPVRLCRTRRATAAFPLLGNAAGRHAVPAAIHLYASTQRAQHRSITVSPSTDLSTTAQPSSVAQPPTTTQPTAFTSRPPSRRLRSTGH